MTASRNVPYLEGETLVCVANNTIRENHQPNSKSGGCVERAVINADPSTLAYFIPPGFGSLVTSNENVLDVDPTEGRKLNAHIGYGRLVIVERSETRFPLVANLIHRVRVAPAFKISVTNVYADELNVQRPINPSLGQLGNQYLTYRRGRGAF